MGVTFEIEFTDAELTFSAGQRVSGIVLVHVPVQKNNEKISTKEIEIKAKGKAKWAIGQGKNRTVKAHTFFKVAFQVFGDGKLPCRLESENYTFPFDFTLPSDIPSTLTSEFGQIYYQVKVSMQRDWLWARKFKRAFWVSGVLDVANIGSSLGVDFTKQKSICCFCCTSGTVQFTFRMASDKLVTGQLVRFNVLVNNESSKVITEIKVRLMQHIKYKYPTGATQADRKYEMELATRVGLGSSISEEWANGELQIPRDLPPTNVLSIVIHVEYFIQVRLTIKGAMDLVGDIPVFVGTLNSALI